MATVVERLRAALAGRYAVENELGRGGMAVVYLGQDLSLSRRVAIKVFEHGTGDPAAAERFLREVRVAAQLQHPNILPVFESGEADGLLYYIMPYVTGATLRERLEREGPLPIADAVRIAREVAEALDHAHREGIVHRDIKPDNIMLASGVAVVADFGIARAVESGKLTETGMAIGTPNYMSPEQATASPNVDGRADIYALGCVLYEMLTGGPPFSGPTAQAVMARHSTDAVPPISTVRPVPPALEAAVIRALAKLPVDRWSSGRAFADALVAADLSRTSAAPLGTSGRRSALRLAIVAAALAVLATTSWLGWTRLRAARTGAEPTDSLQRIAVLPFTNIGDTSQAYIADGLTEAVHSGLVRAEGLAVTNSSQVAGYRDSVVDISEVGRKLGVSAVVTATVQRIGSSLRVTPHLIDVADGRDVWSDRFNGELVDVFAFQDSITVKIVDALLPRLAPAKRASLARGVRTRDPEAWRLYVQARRAYDEFSRPSAERSLALLRQAIARDSMFSDAWAALVNTLDLAARFSRDPPEAFNAAMRMAANKAVELDSLNGNTYAARAWTRALGDWDWEGARRDMRRAVGLSPGSPDVLRNYADLWLFLNEPDSVLSYARRGFDSTAAAYDHLTWAFLSVGHPDSALLAAERAAAVDSNYSGAYLSLSLVYVGAGRRADGDRALARFLAFSGDDAQGFGWACVYYRRAGDLRGARAMLARLTRIQRERSWGIHSAMSMARLALGDRAGALDAVEAAERAREYLLPATLLNALAPLEGEPRFEAVRRRVFGGRALPRSLFP